MIDLYKPFWHTLPGITLPGLLHLGAERISVLQLGSPVRVSTLRAVIGGRYSVDVRAKGMRYRYLMPGFIIGICSDCELPNMVPY
jgi:hypothetical protein